MGPGLAGRPVTAPGLWGPGISHSTGIGTSIGTSISISN